MKPASIIEYAGNWRAAIFMCGCVRAGRDELGILIGQLDETGEKLQNMFEELQREHT